MTVCRLHGFGALAILRAVILGESDDTVASSMNSETIEKFYRADSACAAK